MNIYEILTFFIVYSFAGWVVEVIFHAAFHGRVVNRGFLNGPVCPVYGFGMVAVLSVFHFIGTDNPLKVFAVGVVLTTLIELLAGFLLDRLFHARWWDYSEMPLNLHGYICPAFSLIWGIAVAFAVNVVHPYIQRFTVGLIPFRTGIIIGCVLLAVFIVDTVLTALTLIGFNRKLQELDDISSALRSVSDRMSDHIGSGALRTTQKVQTSRIRYELGKAELEDHIEGKRAEAGALRAELKAGAEARRSELTAETRARLEELQARYDKLIDSITVHRHFGSGRLLRVFPNVKHRDFKDLLNELRRNLE